VAISILLSTNAVGWLLLTHFSLGIRFFILLNYSLQGTCSNIQYLFQRTFPKRKNIYLISENTLHGYNNIQHFNFQLMHTTLKNVELLKHFKISKNAPACFGLQGNHHQGASIST